METDYEIHYLRDFDGEVHWTLYWRNDSVAEGTAGSHEKAEDDAKNALYVHNRELFSDKQYIKAPLPIVVSDL